MTHRFLNLFVDGKWTGNPDRTIRIDGVVHDMDEYAKEHGIELPDQKPTKNKTKVNSYADMEQPLDAGSDEVDGNGNSESE